MFPGSRQALDSTPGRLCGKNRLHSLLALTRENDMTQTGKYALSFLVHRASPIRESVDSLCRDDADKPMPPYI